jgi:hypothetical protein
MTEVILRKTNIAGRPCLVSVDDEGADLLHKLKDGRDVECGVVQRRNIRHHRLLFSLLKLCVERLEAFPNTDIALIALKIGCGLCTAFIDRETGKTFYVPKSISFASMDQTEFNKFFDAAVALIANRWAPPRTTPEDIRKEILEMTDGPHALAERRA